MRQPAANPSRAFCATARATTRTAAASVAGATLLCRSANPDGVA